MLFSKTRNGRIECPLCRAEVSSKDLYPIYLQFRDPNAPQSQAVDGEPMQEIYSTDMLTELAGLHANMEAISADSSAEYIKRTALKLQDVLSDVEAQSCTVTVMSGISQRGERSADGGVYAGPPVHHRARV